MAALVKDASWTPRLHNGIYCSPACGCGCTKAAYDKAVKASAALASRFGEGWKPEVWENGGWHWKIAKGKLEVYGPSNSREGYLAFYQGTPQFHAHGDTAEDALGFVTQDARTCARRIEADLAEPQP